MTDPLRVFVALPVPDPVVRAVDERVGALRDRYADLRWARPDGWHVTLAFLGQVPWEEVPTVVGVVSVAVAEVDARPVELTVSGPGHFNRRILWLGIDDEPAGAVATLGAVIQDRIATVRLPVDEKSVHPHLTLARTRGRSRLPRSITDDVPQVEASWTVEAVEVLSSTPGRSGSRYELLEQVALRRPRALPPGRGSGS